MFRFSPGLSALVFACLACVAASGGPASADTPPADGKMLTFNTAADVDKLEHMPGVVLVDLYAFW